MCYMNRILLTQQDSSQAAHLVHALLLPFFHKGIKLAEQFVQEGHHSRAVHLPTHVCEIPDIGKQNCDVLVMLAHPWQCLTRPVHAWKQSTDMLCLHHLQASTSATSSP